MMHFRGALFTIAPIAIQTIREENENLLQPEKVCSEFQLSCICKSHIHVSEQQKLNTVHSQSHQ